MFQTKIEDKLELEHQEEITNKMYIKNIKTQPYERKHSSGPFTLTPHYIIAMV